MGILKMLFSVDSEEHPSAYRHAETRLAQALYLKIMEETMEHTSC